jgi:hypothetical protein
MFINRSGCSIMLAATRPGFQGSFMRLLIAPVLALGLSGCLAKTAVDIVTLPVKVVSAGVDAVTTSQKEADEKRGRALRRHEECTGKEARKADKEHREPDYSRCPDPDGGRRR